MKEKIEETARTIYELGSDAGVVWGYGGAWELKRNDGRTDKEDALEELTNLVQKQVEEAVRGFAEEIISKLSADVVTPVEIDGLDNRYYKAEKILTLIHDLQNEVIERILK